MRRVLCLAPVRLASAAFAVSAVLLAGPATAQEKPKPNTLTPKEVADGWVLLFDGETTFGWKTDGAAEVKDGELVLGKDGKPALAYPTTYFGISGELFCEIEGQVDVRAVGYDMSGRKAGDWAFIHYSIVRTPSADGMTHIRLQAEASASFETGKMHDFPKEAANAPVVIRPMGKVGVRVRSVKFRPLDTKPLFNGKDLTGWKAFAGEKYKSKFAVTPAGEISVKDGPGDLQTDKAFGNFVLQLECKTNGKALNSGIFFRCLADQYQQGYEAQIQNAFVADDRTKPADYGTGAIYRRSAARKVVSNDNEWFTMTVAANGKHISTWVNGYQTVDWTDERPAEENARKGYRAGKGHISIQGHDPTTDILFRNIRIAELK